MMSNSIIMIKYNDDIIYLGCRSTARLQLGGHWGDM